MNYEKENTLSRPTLCPKCHEGYMIHFVAKNETEEHSVWVCGFPQCRYGFSVIRSEKKNRLLDYPLYIPCGKEQTEELDAQEQE